MIARRHGRAAATLPASYWAAIPNRPARCCLICRLPLAGRARHSLVDPARVQTATTRRCGGDGGQASHRDLAERWP